MQRLLFKPMCPAQYTIPGNFQTRLVSLKSYIYIYLFIYLFIYSLSAFHRTHRNSRLLLLTENHTKIMYQITIGSRPEASLRCRETELFESSVSGRFSPPAELIYTSKERKRELCILNPMTFKRIARETCFVELRERGVNKFADRRGQLPEISVDKKFYIHISQDEEEQFLFGSCCEEDIL